MYSQRNSPEFRNSGEFRYRSFHTNACVNMWHKWIRANISTLGIKAWATLPLVPRGTSGPSAVSHLKRRVDGCGISAKNHGLLTAATRQLSCDGALGPRGPNGSRGDMNAQAQSSLSMEVIDTMLSSVRLYRISVRLYSMTTS